MDAIRLAARLEHRTLDELEAGFADRVSAVFPLDGPSRWALFLGRGQLLGGDDVVVGARVHVEVLTSGGEAGLVVDGVVAWSIPAHQAPPGREAGVGVAVVSVDDDTAARLQRMGARPGAGARVRIPGQRLAQRLRLGETLPDLTPRPPAPSTPPADTPATQPFATLFAGTPESEADAFLHASTVELPAPPRPRLMGLLADRALGDSEPSGAIADSRPPTDMRGDLRAEMRAALADIDDDDDDDLPVPGAPELFVDLPDNNKGFLEAPTLDGVDSDSGEAQTSPPTQESSSSTTTPPSSAPSSSSSSSSLSSASAPPGLESLPDAPPLDGSPFADDGAAKPFESQSTDIDLLSSISAKDIVSLDLAAQQAQLASQPPMAEPPLTTPAEAAWQNVDDLPSADADLVSAEGAEGESAAEWELRTDHSRPDDEGADWPSLDLGETMVLELRSLPDPDPWPVWSDLLDARTIGMFCSYGRRGQANVEMFSWPLQGSKRFSRADPAPEPAADVDVFASGADSDDLFGPSLEVGRDDNDPFAPAGTDPRLNVEGVVARNVRAAHGDENDNDVFSVSGEGDDNGAGGLLDEATRDEMPMPHLVVHSSQASDLGDAPWADAADGPARPAGPPGPPLLPAVDVATEAGDGETDRDLRRPPPKS